MHTLSLRHHLQLAMHTCCLLTLIATATAQEPTWKTAAAFDRALAQPISVTWHERGLREGLARLAAETAAAMFLDRRIDPHQPITLTVASAPLETLLDQVAAAANAQTARIGSVVYIGPSETAAELATIAALRRQSVTKLPSERQPGLLKSALSNWPELTEPRQLVEQLAREADFRVTNIEKIPHDLWPGVSLPALPWTDRLTLVLAGFHLTFEFNQAGDAITLKPIQPGNIIKKRYRRQNAANLIPQLKRVLPTADIRLEQGEIVLIGRQEDHEKLERLLSGQTIRTQSAAVKSGETVFTLRATGQPAGAVIRQVAQSLGKEFRYDDAALEKLTQPVTLDFQKATTDEVLKATLQPLGLTYKFTETELVITAKK